MLIWGATMNDSRAPKGDDKRAPFNLEVHSRAAFGGAFGSLNLLIGAVSIARQIAHGFSLGVSPVLKGIFATYVSIFHGIVDFFAAYLSWISGFDVHVPAWAHDWIVLWFVFAGATFRLVTARNRIVRAAKTWTGISQVRQVRRVLTNWLISIEGQHIAYFESQRPIAVFGRALRKVLVYSLTIFLWPLVLLEIFLRPANDWGFVITQKTGEAFVRINYPALFWLQTLAIILAIFGLSVLNAQTM